MYHTIITTHMRLFGKKLFIIKHNIYGNNLLILSLKYSPKLTNLTHYFFHLSKQFAKFLFKINIMI